MNALEANLQRMVSDFEEAAAAVSVVSNNIEPIPGGCSVCQFFYASIEKYNNVPFSRPLGATENDAQELHAQSVCIHLGALQSA